MPVIPAPTTSTSTSGEDASIGSRPPGDFCTDRLVWRTRPRYPEGEGTRHGDRRAEVDAAPGPSRHGVPGPGAEGALLRRRLLRVGERAPVAARLADGVPARGDPRGPRLRGVRVPRPVGDRPPQRRP